MKKSILFLVLLQSLLIFAQAPQKMTYQSVVRNSTNALLTNQAVGVRISIVEGSLTGAAVYSETHAVTTNANGLFTLEVGGGNNQSSNFAEIAWSNGSHFIKSEIDPAGGTNYTLSATKELLSVPYALYAANGITTAQADAINAQEATNTSQAATNSTIQAQIDAQATIITTQAAIIAAQATTTTAQADAINAQAATNTSQAATNTYIQAQITAMQAQITSLLIPTVLIGNQSWVQKNLSVTTYRDGSVIPEVQDATVWASLTTGAWCHYNNDPANDAFYGKLYNWYAVNDPRGLAPSGFHVSTDTELGSVTNLKDPAGFAGLPGGSRSNNGLFNGIGNFGYWWSSSAYNTNRAWYRYVYSIDGTATRTQDNNAIGFSVRCLRD